MHRELWDVLERVGNDLPEDVVVHADYGKEVREPRDEVLERLVDLNISFAAQVGDADRALTLRGSQLLRLIARGTVWPERWRSLRELYEVLDAPELLRAHAADFGASALESWRREPLRSQLWLLSMGEADLQLIEDAGLRTEWDALRAQVAAELERQTQRFEGEVRPLVAPWVDGRSGSHGDTTLRGVPTHIVEQLAAMLGPQFLENSYAGRASIAEKLQAARGAPEDCLWDGRIQVIETELPHAWIDFDGLRLPSHLVPASWRGFAADDEFFTEDPESGMASFWFGA